MSRNGTMSSALSNQAFQQQQNLKELQNMENNYNAYQQSKSLTSNDPRTLNEVRSSEVATSPLQQQTQQFQQPPQQLNSLGSSSLGRPQNPTHQQASSRVVSSLDAAQARINSLQVSPSAHSDPCNPLNVVIPTGGNPTEVLAARFAAWRAIVGSLLQYLNESVGIQDEVVRQHIRLSHAVNFGVFQSQGTRGSSNGKEKSRAIPQATHHTIASSANKEKEEVLTSNFFCPQGNGSIQDLPQILVNYHASSAALAQRSSKDLSINVIPRLEDLRRELLVKIKEIKGLSSDFKNSVNKELAQTKIELQNYLKSIEDAKFNSHSIQPKNDPYLTKIILDRQIKRQIVEENFLYDAYINLQSSGKELEKVVVIEVQNALTIFAKLQGEAAQNVFDKLISNLDYGFLTKPPSFEWDQFVAKDKNFIDENLPKRDYRNVSYDKINDPLTLEIRSSFLEKRSKFLKSYSRGYYVLTPTFFHEFKSQDRKKDLIPVMSLPIDEIELEEHSKKDSKFVLKKVGRLSPHKYMFRAESYEVMMQWYNDIKNLKSLTSPASRGVYASKHHTEKLEVSRVSSRTSRVVRTSTANDSAHEVDTILTAPNNNQNLPPTDDSPIPISNDAIYVKQVGAESTPIAQRQSMPAQGYQQQPSQYQRFSLQMNTNQQQQQQYQPHQQLQQQPPQQQYLVPQQQYRASQPPPVQNSAPYPTQQAFLDGRYPQMQQPMFQEQLYQAPTPSVYIEAPTPMAANSSVITPQRSSMNPRQSSETFRSGGAEPDGSGLSEETDKKETHEQDIDESFEATKHQDMNGVGNGKSTRFQE